MKHLFLSLRPKQWIKNTFIFIPLIFGKRLLIFPANLKVFFAFCLFSLSASAAYLINDILDIEKDKRHPIKSLRPIASGKVNIRLALTAAFILLVFSITLSFILNIYFGYIIIVYSISNFFYSKILKKVVIIDVFSLAFFYLLRILSGGVVAEVKLSYWVIIMIALLAMFLGFNKRRQELDLFQEKAIRHRSILVEYDIYFIDQMIAVITSSITIVYMLYTVDIRTIREFGTTKLLLTMPFVYYGIFRYLYLIHKVKKDDDPIRILLSDIPLQLSIVLWIIACSAIIYF
ncbi:MAG: decaprenyl-phosphate phosphoribosyltransferase [Candidatus Omnitrophota bacterium]